jgi:hypothetical protein
VESRQQRRCAPRGRKQAFAVIFLAFAFLSTSAEFVLLLTFPHPCRASDNACDNQSTWEDKLYAALQSVEAPGKFATSAAYTQDLSATPLITVQGVGPLSVPLSMRQAAALLLAGRVV